MPVETSDVEGVVGHNRRITLGQLVPAPQAQMHPALKFHSTQTLWAQLVLYMSNFGNEKLDVKVINAEGLLQIGLHILMNN